MNNTTSIENAARMGRLAELAETMTAPDYEDEYQGADYRLAFHFLLQEIGLLKDEFFEHCKDAFQHHPHCKAHHEKLGRVMDQSETVLMDSIDPAKDAQERKAKLRVFPCTEKETPPTEDDPS